MVAVAAVAAVTAVAAVAAVEDKDGVQWSWWGGHSMAVAAFYSNGIGIRWALALDGGDGRHLWQQWTIEIDTAVNGGNAGGVQWHSTVFDGISNVLRQGNGEAKMAPAWLSSSSSSDCASLRDVARTTATTEWGIHL